MSSMKIKRKLPDAPEPTRATYKKPVAYTASKHLRVVELPCQYNPRPAPIPIKKKEPVKKVEKPKKTRVFKKRTWTDDKVQQAIEMYHSGVKISEMAKTFGVSKPHMSTMLSALRSNGTLKEARCAQWTDEEEKALIIMYERGDKYKAIGDALGKPAGGVYQKIARLREKGLIGGKRKCRKR